jgi:integrase
MQYWLNEMYAPRAAESSVYGFKNIINRYIAPEMGNIKLQKLKPMAIQKYYNSLMNEKGLSPNTVHKHHDVLNAALNAAVKQEYLHRNPMSGVERPKKINHEANVYTAEQLQILFDSKRQPTGNNGQNSGLFRPEARRNLRLEMGGCRLG